MYYNYNHYPYPPYNNTTPKNMYQENYSYNPYPYFINPPINNMPYYQHLASELTPNNRRIDLRDYGPEPFVVDIEDATEQNRNFRTSLWTGEYLQLVLMSIDVGGDIGLEMHPDVDQFIRIEQGQGMVQMGDTQDLLDFEETVAEDYIIIIPAGKWHNLTNTGNRPLKLYTLYAPPQHPHGTIHETQEDSVAAERNSNNR